MKIAYLTKIIACVSRSLGGQSFVDMLVSPAKVQDGVFFVENLCADVQVLTWTLNRWSLVLKFLAQMFSCAIWPRLLSCVRMETIQHHTTLSIGSMQLERRIFTIEVFVSVFCWLNFRQVSGDGLLEASVKKSREQWKQKLGGMSVQVA
jgi:hypothetical protein